MYHNAEANNTKKRENNNSMISRIKRNIKQFYALSSTTISQTKEGTHQILI